MAEAKKGGNGVRYYEGRPVLVTDAGIFPLPAPLAVGEDALTDSPEEYDAGAAAAAATTAETEGVKQSTA